MKADNAVLLVLGVIVIGGVIFWSSRYGGKEKYTESEQAIINRYESRIEEMEREHASHIDAIRSEYEYNGQDTRPYKCGYADGFVRGREIGQEEGYVQGTFDEHEHIKNSLAEDYHYRLPELLTISEVNGTYGVEYPNHVKDDFMKEIEEYYGEM